MSAKQAGRRFLFWSFILLICGFLITTTQLAQCINTPLDNIPQEVQDTLPLSFWASFYKWVLLSVLGLMITSWGIIGRLIYIQWTKQEQRITLLENWKIEHEKDTIRFEETLNHLDEIIKRLDKIRE